MAHHVYQTEALVLWGADMREANRFVDVFTRELGLIRAVAQSARKESSKMRYSLQDYTHLDISLVRGREVWRITGAQERSNGYYQVKNNEHKLTLLKRVNMLLRRLLHGEEKNDHLYDTVLSFRIFLEKNDVRSEDCLALESLVVLRILYHLGYVGKKEIIFETNSYDKEHVDIIRRSQKEMIAEINNALKESQL